MDANTSRARKRRLSRDSPTDSNQVPVATAAAASPQKDENNDIGTAIASPPAKRARRAHVQIDYADSTGDEADNNDDENDHNHLGIQHLHHPAMPFLGQMTIDFAEMGPDLLGEPPGRPHYGPVDGEEPTSENGDDENDDAWATDDDNGEDDDDEHGSVFSNASDMIEDPDGLDVTEYVDQALELHVPNFTAIPLVVQSGISSFLTRRLFAPAAAMNGPVDPDASMAIASDALEAQGAIFEYIAGRPTRLLNLLADQAHEADPDFDLLRGGVESLMRFATLALQEESRARAMAAISQTMDMNADALPDTGLDGGDFGGDFRAIVADKDSDAGWSDASDASSSSSGADDTWRDHSDDDDDDDDDTFSSVGSDGDGIDDGNGLDLNPTPAGGRARPYLKIRDLDQWQYEPAEWTSLCSRSYFSDIASLARGPPLFLPCVRAFALPSTISHFQCANQLALGDIVSGDHDGIQRPLTLDGSVIFAVADGSPPLPITKHAKNKVRVVAGMDATPITIAAGCGYIVTGGEGGDLRVYCTMHGHPSPSTWGVAPVVKGDLIAMYFKSDMYNAVQIYRGPPGSDRVYALVARNRGRVECYRLPGHNVAPLADGTTPQRPHSSPAQSAVTLAFQLSTPRGTCVNDAKIAPTLDVIAGIGDSGIPWVASLDWIAAEADSDEPANPRAGALHFATPATHLGLQCLAERDLKKVEQGGSGTAAVPRGKREQYAAAWLAGVTCQYLAWAACGRRFATSCDTRPYVLVWRVVEQSADSAASGFSVELERILYVGRPTFAIQFNPSAQFASLLAVSHRHGCAQVMDLDSDGANGDSDALYASCVDREGEEDPEALAAALNRWTGGNGEVQRREVVSILGPATPLTQAKHSFAVTGMQWGYDGYHLYLSGAGKVHVYRIASPRSLVDLSARRAWLSPPPGVSHVDWDEELTEEQQERFGAVHWRFDRDLRH
ncbi:hypothetical protein BC828DRAFT_375435 [Blastocladiella britannica]|nr:hypothetical protein BC828DRAFT_375435 [Blastocladiella britannica]